MPKTPGENESEVPASTPAADSSAEPTLPISASDDTPRTTASSDGFSSPTEPIRSSPEDTADQSAIRTGEQPTTPIASTTPYYAETNTEPIETLATPVAVGDGSSFRRRERPSGLLVPLIAVAIVAALLGGTVGALITHAVTPASSTTVGSGTTQPSNATINNPKSATAISTVAAKASASVVTISVSSTSESGTGSGIVLTADGYVLTNNHVVTLDGASSAGTISVTASDGRIYAAKVVGTDPTNDLAVIKLTGASGMQAATFADSSKLNVGDTAIAIGAPLGLAGTVTNGIVSALGRSITVASSAVPDSSSDDTDSGSSEDPFNFWGGGSSDTGTTTSTTSIYLAVVQTDAAINPGNSGGALLNANGEVIGVNVAIASASSSSSSSDSQTGSIGVGFAIPSNVAKRIGTELINKEKATHGLLGASVEDATTTVSGASVKTVSSGGAAATAGLKAGDVVTRFNGVAVSSSTDLTAQVRALAGGSTTTLVYVRDGKSSTVSVKLGTYTG